MGYRAVDSTNFEPEFMSLVSAPNENAYPSEPYLFCAKASTSQAKTSGLNHAELTRLEGIVTLDFTQVTADAQASGCWGPAVE